MKGRKVLALIVCVVFAVSLAGCGGKATNGTSNTEKVANSTSSTVSTTSVEESHTLKISDEKATLSYFGFKLEAYSENLFTEAFKMTNVLMEPTLSQNVTDTDQALALAVASKQIPDAVYDWQRENFVKYGLQGALIPLNELIDKYAPNYKAFLEKNPDVKYFSTASDGNIYFIPFVADGEAATGWFIRQDWLDKLNLKTPETVDDLYKTMVAFRDGDPNGNGKKDEVPFFGCTAEVGPQIEPLLSVLDATDKFRYQNGKVTYGPMEDGFKTAIKEIGKWYKEGLIDKEIFTRADARGFFLPNNTGGITSNWFGSTAATNTTYKDSIPGFKFVPMAPPASPSGVKKATDRRVKTNGEGWAISAQNKNPELTMKYFDFWWSKEGRQLASFGIEGKQYDMVDGKPVLKEEILKGETPVSALMLHLRGDTNFGFWQDFACEEQWANSIALEGMKMYSEKGYFPEIKEVPSLIYTNEQEKRHNTLKTQVETYLNESMQQWILGGRDIEKDFEQFRTQMRTLGVDELVAIEQEAYDSYLNMGK
jgi:ABC-type sugar transport system, periplasmic component